MTPPNIVRICLKTLDGHVFVRHWLDGRPASEFECRRAEMLRKGLLLLGEESGPFGRWWHVIPVGVSPFPSGPVD